MRQEFVGEAAKCRAEAKRFRGLPDEPFLIRLAEEFEHLSAAQAGGTRDAAERQGA
jgi:hypothetical protein